MVFFARTCAKTYDSRVLTVIIKVPTMVLYYLYLSICPRTMVTDGSVGVPSPSGWMDATIFVKYLNHFIRCVKPNPCLLILDGHVSHKSLEAITLAKENFISMITFLPHTSHTGLPTGILKCQITRIWHFSKAFGSENLALAVWHFLAFILLVWQ